MPPRVLVFGAGGKLGSAVAQALAGGWEVVPVVRTDVDIRDGDALGRFLAQSSPDAVVNAVVFGGVDACELDPATAFAVNTLFPRQLAARSEEHGFALVHVSSDAVFPDAAPGAFHTEDSPVGPCNVYGASKYAADCLVAATASRAYVLRLSVMFGERRSPPQFLERMLQMAMAGREVLRVSDDIVVSPSYSPDVATAVRRILESSLPCGLYHVANEGCASLYELVSRAVACLGLPVRVEPVGHDCFPGLGRRSLRTPIRSVKIPPLRPWQEALADYCRRLTRERESTHDR